MRRVEIGKQVWFEPDTFADAFAIEAEAHSDDSEIESVNPGSEVWTLEWSDYVGSAYDLDPVIAWSKNRVYFTHSYDSMLSVCSVPRHPVDDEIKEHIK